MSQGKVKLYKNPERNEITAHQPYVPQYQLLGVEPEEWKSNPVPEKTPVLQDSQDNPRIKNIGLRQDINKNSGVPSKNFSLPNVGNNRDYTWSGVDGEIVNDLEGVNINSSMIDNNDYISEQALGFSSQEDKSSSKRINISSEEDSNIFDAVKKIKDKDYLLLINGVVVCSGPLDEVEEQVKKMAFGEHEICNGEPIPVNELIVLKKIPIKIGVFLD